MVIAAAAPARDNKPETRQSAVKQITYAAPKRLCVLANRKIDESSGIAISRRTKDIFWTHNDSGDKANIYAFDMNGNDLGTFRIIGAKANDWEDMASFTIANKPYLLLADTGDNNRQRKTYDLYILPEPTIRNNTRKWQKSAKVKIKITFTYPDGPHDCESVAVDTVGKMIYLATKTDNGKAKLYAISLPARTPTGVIRAKVIARLSVPYATAMDISADNKRAVVLTYFYAMEFTRSYNQTWAKAFAGQADFIMMPLRKQGESICYGPDNKTLYLTSEQLPTPLWVIPVKKDSRGRDRGP